VCGDYPLLPTKIQQSGGSSQRVRGLLNVFMVIVSLYRIIPACAGTIHFWFVYGPLAEDHPSVCGDYLADGCLKKRTPGSSQRVRGLFRESLNDLSTTGIIPACAGTMADSVYSALASADHPSVCGDYCIPRLLQVTFMGSSQRVRGLFDHIDLVVVNHGIIPACAGTIDA